MEKVKIRDFDTVITDTGFRCSCMDHYYSEHKHPCLIEEVRCRGNFIKHECTPSCMESKDVTEIKNVNPLMIPIFCGWGRKFFHYIGEHRRRKNTPCQVVYRTPCGKHLRSLPEIDEYLKIVNSRISIESFSLNPDLKVFRTYKLEQNMLIVKDITQGKEKMEVSCCITNEKGFEPPQVYEPNVINNIEENRIHDFQSLTGCTCVDNCQTPGNCECQQMTYFGISGLQNNGDGYEFGRLKEPILTGIYECNQYCKCNSQCGNRIVQKGLRILLQIFKTKEKGVGVRCLHDIDAGQFICIYAGEILTDQEAEMEGIMNGDEYFASLDHIEKVEEFKEGYEVDVKPPTSIKKQKRSFDVSSKGVRELLSRKTKTKAERKMKERICEKIEQSRNGLHSIKNICVTSSNCELSYIIYDYAGENIEGKKDSLKNVFKRRINNQKQKYKKKSEEDTKKRWSLSNFYTEEAYVVNGKHRGNVAKYFNHSCSPNLFPQNVFVNTHDLRFPTVAFFAESFIKAGTELTWDYGYQIGSVKDKEILCKCESDYCKKRIL